MNNRNVYMHGFVCDDAALFLDTHPDCPHARHLYQENAAQYNQARKQYAVAGKPLFRTDAVSAAVGAGLMNHGHGKEVTANVGL